MKKTLKNPLSVYLAAITKLVLDAILIVAFADKLTAWKVFDEIPGLHDKAVTLAKSYLHIDLTISLRAFFLLCAAGFAVLYLLLIATLRIRNRTGYLLYSLVFVFDAIFLMQPAKTLVLFLLCTLVLLCLRIKGSWRYVPVFALIAGYALWRNIYLLGILPLFFLAILWRRSDKWGFRAFLLMVVSFCLLYQFGYLQMLPHARGYEGGATFLNNRFEDEELMGHVSYFLVNYAVILGRILVPYEVFTKSACHAWPFFFLQLGAIVLYLRTFLYLIDVDFTKGNYREDDRIQYDALAFVLSFVAILALCEPDLGQVFRHMTGLTPFFLYLLFEANHRHYKPVLSREFAGTCPVIFFHHGDEDYVYDAIEKAGRICGSQNVILLGDKSNQGFSTNWYCSEDYLKEDAKKFHQFFRHIGREGADDFEKTCFDRHFALASFCREKGITECFFLDSDVLIYENPLNYRDASVCFGCCNAKLPISLGEVAAPHFLYWKTAQLEQFLKFVVRVYSSETKWLEDVSNQVPEADGYSNQEITDGILLTAWKRISEEQNPDFVFRDFSMITDECTCDYSLTSADNEIMDEYVMNRLLGIKKFHFEKGLPILTAKDGRKVTARILHCQNKKEAYTSLLVKASNFTPMYLLRRIGHKIMG